jgi:hypothetical protein
MIKESFSLLYKYISLLWACGLFVPIWHQEKALPPSPSFLRALPGGKPTCPSCHGTACPEYATVTGQHVPSTRLSRDSMFRVRGCHGTACSEYAAVTGQHVPSTRLYCNREKNRAQVQTVKENLQVNCYETKFNKM